MKLRTEIKPQKSTWNINHNSGVFTMGSCFADVIGQKLKINKFKVLPNPFGNIFNPLSCYSLIQKVVDRSHNIRTVNRDDRWFSYDLHSELAATSEKALLDAFQEKAEESESFLKHAEYLILTFGTAFAYKLLHTNEIVANCQKQPPEKFEKFLLAPEEIVSDFKQLHKELKAFNPGLKVILTVSPVRHIKDTIELNSVSKSILRYAAHRISNEVQEVFYFPAFEIINDDLRDYRFYKSDLIHPTEVAEDYVWDIFSKSFFKEETLFLIEKWQKVKKDLNHKPFNPGSTSYKTFLSRTMERLKELENMLNVQEEIRLLKEKME